MSGLKAFIPKLSKLVGMSPAALYERQRALVGAGLLETKSGRGPGSGVRLTAESVAMLLISLLATDSLSEVEERTRAVARLKTSHCALTGRPTFGSALAAVLASEDLWRAVDFVGVTRTGPLADIHYKREPNSRVSTVSAFGTEKEKQFAGVVAGAQIRESTFHAIASALAAAMKGKPK